jgi:isoaspartyl peptidase/L-asparaginase-like protein (Ntn-hydrolase superfamily)
VSLKSACIVSTWVHGKAANAAGWAVLSAGGPALDAVEAAVGTAEADPAVRSVGLGGYPDRDGRVTLDAAIMDHQFNCGSVAGLEHIVHATSVARHVMEATPHVMLAGEGALEFALQRGFRKERLVTAETLSRYEERYAAQAVPVPNIENHDTIASLALDAQGRLAGACTTSGLTGRLHGRVGDSPIIGAGLYVDGEVGAAAATGVGELALRAAASALVVERMRAGASAQDACEAVISFIRGRLSPGEHDQLALIALGRGGTEGAASLLDGFSWYVKRADDEPASAARS